MTGHRRPDRVPNWLRERPIAHRGLYDNRHTPENSCGAFEACAASGTPIELDCRLSRDGVVVVIHDADLKRVCGDAVRVADMDASALAAMRLFGTAHGVPTLADAIACAEGRTPLLIEIKNAGAAGALEEAIVRTLAKARATDIAIQSFNPRTLAWFARHAPAYPRGQLVSDFADRPDMGAARKLVLRAMVMNVVARPDFIAVDLHALTRLYAAYVRAWSDCVLAWTVRGPHDRAICRRYGLNAIFDPADPLAR